MKTISLKLDETLANWLENEARKLGRTKSEVAREALERSRNGKLGPSVHDIMKDVCGISKRGPRDLATNKKYMRNFGRGRRAA
jgi:hypothetical protein